MAELRRGLRFANEARAHVGIEREIGRQDLDRDGAVQSQIGRAVDDGHSAAPDLTFDQVLGADRDGDAVAQIVVHAYRAAGRLAGRVPVVAHLVGHVQRAVDAVGEIQRVHRERRDVLRRLRAGVQPDEIELDVLQRDDARLELGGDGIAPRRDVGDRATLPLEVREATHPFVAARSRRADWRRSPAVRSPPRARRSRRRRRRARGPTARARASFTLSASASAERPTSGMRERSAAGMRSSRRSISSRSASAAADAIAVRARDAHDVVRRRCPDRRGSVRRTARCGSRRRATLLAHRLPLVAIEHARARTSASRRRRRSGRGRAAGGTRRANRSRRPTASRT